MILYLDTSSLVKLYVEEEGSNAVRGLVENAAVVTTNVIAYPEARSALARLHREAGSTAEQHERMKSDLHRDWSALLTLQVTEKIWRHAGELTESYALRGFDSLHLASYLALAGLDLAHPVRFSSYDRNLNHAADLALAEQL